MVFKINIGTKNGKTYKLETEAKSMEGKELRQKILGKDLDLNSELKSLEDYEFEISGASDKAGFTSLESVPGTGLKGVLLSYEKGMKKRSKREGKKKRSSYTPKGLRLRKTVRGKVISQDTVQINLKILKEGKEHLEKIFPEQNKPKEEIKK
ncbi:hypothetical protein HYS72_03345 [Candidatus Pacearchaeota archaeon]|nr:hypothetical protein [Candidatus Pacearchaeota archaeon]MBI2057127.1 hypothetical protein [Candidatus Pacearchaeota archaeon]